MAEITTTPGQLVRKALLLIGAIDRDQALTGTELNDGVDTLNTMLASWASNKLKVPVVTQESFTLTAGQNGHTLGESGADYTTDRPLAILAAFIRDGSNYDYHLDPMSRLQYNSVANKTDPGRPTRFYYHPSAPLATLYFDYTPSTAEVIHLDMQKGLGNFTDPDTAITLPANYILPLQFNLSILLAPEYGLTTSEEVKGTAFDSLNDLKVLNSEPFISKLDEVTLHRRPTIDGYYDDYNRWRS